MKSTLVKYVLLGISMLGLLVIVIVTIYQVSFALKFLNQNSLPNPALQETPNYTFFDLDNHDIRISKYTSHLNFGAVELHQEQIHYQSDIKDTLQQYKYITLAQFQDNQAIDKKWIAENDSSIFDIRPVDYANLQTRASIPYEKDHYYFWSTFLLSRLLINAIIFGNIALLVFLMVKNAFNDSPFTKSIRNKLYAIGALIISYVAIDFLYTTFLWKFVWTNYHLEADALYNFLSTWLFMGLLILFIATIFDYGIRLKEEQDLTI